MLNAQSMSGTVSIDKTAALPVTAGEMTIYFSGECSPENAEIFFEKIKEKISVE